MRNNKVLIAGAGIGGLATALRLAVQGFDVEILEKNSQAGGRLNQLKKDGFTFDTGPSFFSMSYEFKEFAESCGIELPFRYVGLDPLYSVHFRDNPKTYYLHRDIKKLADQFRDSEPDFEEKMKKYLDKSGRLFHDTIDLVIKKNFNSVFSFLITLLRVNPVHIPVLFRSYWQHVKLYFSSREARQIISLVAFFLGRTPFDTLAVYSLLSYTEFKHDGYFNVEGGMYKIVEGLVAELKNAGVQITYNTEITGVNHSNGRITSLVDQHGTTHEADMFVINADAAVFRSKILQRKNYSEQKMRRMSWTTGYLTFYIGLKGKLPQVNHHNYYLGYDFEEYARKVLEDPETLQNPYYYVNVLSKHNPDCAPDGCESLFFVCPVPNLLVKPDWSDRDTIVDSILTDFSARINQDIKPDIISKTIYTPLDWQDKYNLYQGSGLGLSHTLGQIGAFRPSNVDEKFRNLFYVGASTTPGAGLPMAIISSKLVTGRVVDFHKKISS